MPHRASPYLLSTNSIGMGQTEDASLNPLHVLVEAVEGKFHSCLCELINCTTSRIVY